MRLSLFLLLVAMASLVISGCASKGYVDEQIASLKATQDAEINNIKSQSGLNADEIKELKAMNAELSEKADLALNQAKGFENYVVIWEGVVNFDFDSYDLSQFAKDNLEELGQKMIDYPRSLLELAGHTDKSGSDNYNMMLGMKRAESVKKYMVDQFGIALYRMFTVTHGETKPVALPDEKDANTKNRRVTLKLWGEL
jgi:outer membrane protein OmpA-like peptidoglycan-associated protein